MLPSKLERHTILCFLLMLAGFTEGMECQVDDIVFEVNNLTSTINYKILQDSNCNDKKEWEAYLTSCVMGEKFLQTITLQVSGGHFPVMNKGMWKMELPGYKSKCFSVSGTIVIPSLVANFNERGLNFTFTEPDERIKTWDLRIYRAQKETKCGATWEFSEIDHITSVGNRSSLQLNYRFNTTDCYCFELYPVGNITLSSGGRFKVLDCKPEPEIRDPKKKNNTEFKLWQVLTLMTLTAVTVIATLALFLHRLYKRRYSYTTTSIVSNNTKTARSTLDIREVLLLYAGNLQHHQQTMELKKYLEHYFKVHDLYKYDMERQADCEDWLLRTLLQSSMKIVLVDSPAMATFCRAPSTLHNEQDNVEVLAEKQLRFALRHIITTSLVQDYSRVFVVRFDGVLVEEEKMDHIVSSCWYYFPSQHSLLLSDVSGSIR